LNTEKLNPQILWGQQALEYLKSPDPQDDCETRPSALEELLAAPSAKSTDPDVEAFKECFSRPGAYTDWIMTRPFKGYGGYCGPKFDVPARSEQYPSPTSVQPEPSAPECEPEVLLVNPRTGKGWTDAEENIISQVMAMEGCARIAAIQRAYARNLLGGTHGTGLYPFQPIKPTQKSTISAKNTPPHMQENRLGGDFRPYPSVQQAVRGAESAQGPVGINEQKATIPIPKGKPGRRPKWRTDAERMATIRENRKPLVLPPLPEGVYRARDVLAPKSSKREQTGRRNYHASLQENRCFFCERLFGIYVRKNAAKPEQLRVEDEHFIPRRLAGSRKDENRHAVCHICNRLKSDIAFQSEEQCRSWLEQAWNLNGYEDVSVNAIRYLGDDGSVLFEERLLLPPTPPIQLQTTLKVREL
jgi:hypothetical protein